MPHLILAVLWVLAVVEFLWAADVCLSPAPIRRR